MPKLRPFTWVILAVNAIFVAWIIGGAVSASHQTCSPGLSAQACQSASAIGTGIGVALIIGLWVAADFILGVLWLITRPRGRDCPVCGKTVKPGLTHCLSCGTSFAAVYGGPPRHGA